MTTREKTQIVEEFLTGWSIMAIAGNLSHRKKLADSHPTELVEEAPKSAGQGGDGNAHEHRE